MNISIKNRISFHSVIFIFAFFTYFITAYNSVGYYHADEHYQIIEFAGLKLGTHTPEDLAWEYKEQIRSSIQPAICFFVFKTLNILNLRDPYNQTFILRLLSALIALLIIRFFIEETKKLLADEKLKKVYLLLSYFLWFIPFLSVRFSSETWSGLMFLWALAIFYKDANKEYKIGLILGLSFLFRYQIAFAILGFILWLIFVNRVKVSAIFKMGGSFVLMILLGFVLDSWFYSDWVFTPWKYFLSVIESGGSGFGSSPSYFYVIKILTYPSYFIGIPLIISIIFLCVKNPKSLVIWLIIPFIAIHSIIPHKEERFLFPMAYLFPMILISGYQQLILLLVNKKWLKSSFNILLAGVFILINVTGLIAMGQKSAGIGRMGITKYIHNNFAYKKINLIYCSWANPYNPWQSIPEKFYLEKNMTQHQINNICELNDSLIDSNAVNILVVRKCDLENQKCESKIQYYKYKYVMQSVPRWIEDINEEYKGFENREIVVLYKHE